MVEAKPWRPTRSATFCCLPASQTQGRVHSKQENETPPRLGPLKVAPRGPKVMALSVPPVLVLLCRCQRPSLRPPRGTLATNETNFCTEPNTFCVYCEDTVSGRKLGLRVRG